LHIWKHVHASFRQSDRSSCSHKEPLVEKFFKQPNLLADGARGDIEVFSRPAEAQPPRHGLEGAQGTKRWKRLGHDQTLAKLNNVVKRYRFYKHRVRGMIVSLEARAERAPQKAER
jgi:hypothetical protein